jgi:hypothetical protein
LTWHAREACAGGIRSSKLPLLLRSSLVTNASACTSAALAELLVQKDLLKVPVRGIQKHHDCSSCRSHYKSQLETYKHTTSMTFESPMGMRSATRYPPTRTQEKLPYSVPHGGGNRRGFLGSGCQAAGMTVMWYMDATKNTCPLHRGANNKHKPSDTAAAVFIHAALFQCCGWPTERYTACCQGSKHARPLRPFSQHP